MSEWKSYCLGDLATFKYGKMPDKKKVSDLGKYPVYSGYRYVGYCDEYNIEAGQLIIVARGVGGTGDVKLTREKCWLTNLSIAAKILDYEKVIPQYLYYLFKINNLRYLDSGSAQSQITIFDLERVKVDLPSLEMQKKIVAVLSALDDKIELNNAINKNLEEQARAIYKNMFVDNFNSTWKRGTLSDIAEITMGQSPDGKSYNENKIGMTFFQGRTDFGFRFPKIRMFTTEPKRTARQGDILLSVRAPVGDCNVAIDNCCIGRGLAALSSRNNDDSFLLYTVYNLKEKFDVFNGQGTVFGAINQRELKSMEIFIPEQEMIDKFEEIVKPMDAIIFEKTLENKKLGEIRDALLPRLLSGEIDVSDVEI